MDVRKSLLSFVEKDAHRPTKKHHNEGVWLSLVIII